jgi:outer membrane receptor protein involved in Fe transport
MFGAFFFEEDVSAVTDISYGSDIRPYIDLLAAGALDGLEGALYGPAAVGSVFFQPGQGVIDTSSQDNSAASLFGQFDFHLSDSLTATVGINHTRDEKEVRVTQSNTDVFSAIDLVNDFGGFIPQALFGQAFFDATMLAPTPANIGFISGLPAGAFLPSFPGSGAELVGAIQSGVDEGIAGLQAIQFFPPFLNYPNEVENGESKDSATTYTLRLAYDVNDNTNIYISNATGFKATSWNLSRDSRPFPASISDLTDAGLITKNLTTGTRFASPEDSNVLEIGYKTRFDNGALNLALFNQEIEGFQSNIFTGAGFSLANAGKQSTTGFEFDGLYQATDALTLTAAGTYLSAVYDSFPNGSGVDGPQDLTGEKVRGVHPWSISTSATYNMEFTNGMTGFLRGDYLYESNVRALDNVPEALASRQVNTLNASFGVETLNGWAFTLWGRNITDDEYLLSAFPSVAQAGSFSGYPNQPRTYGLTVKKDF